MKANTTKFKYNKIKLDYEELGKRIKQARRAKGYSQSRLAELAGVSVNTVGKLEINYTTISLNTLLNIANVLEVDVNYLLGHNSSDPPYGLGEKEARLLFGILSAVKAYQS